MMDLLFVTSYDLKMYLASGQKLEASFLKHQKEGHLLNCTESLTSVGRDPRISTYPLDTDPFLHEWLGTYQGICEKQKTYWNKNAHRWFRKAVALRFARKYYCPKIMVWIDCDVVFKKNLPLETIMQWLDGRSILHVKGPNRTHTETGFVVYNRSAPETNEFLSNVWHAYQTGIFMKLSRWDDCWLFDHIRERMPEKFFKDFAGDVGKRIESMPGCPLKEYIQHNKGTHHKAGILKV